MQIIFYFMSGYSYRSLNFVLKSGNVWRRNLEGTRETVPQLENEKFVSLFEVLNSEARVQRRRPNSEKDTYCFIYGSSEDNYYISGDICINLSAGSFARYSTVRIDSLVPVTFTINPHSQGSSTSSIGTIIQFWKCGKRGLFLNESGDLFFYFYPYPCIDVNFSDEYQSISICCYPVLCNYNVKMISCHNINGEVYILLHDGRIGIFHKSILRIESAEEIELKLLDVPLCKQIVCGQNDTALLDIEGILWIKKITNDEWIKIDGLPPLSFVFVGNYHIFVIDMDGFVWGRGNNDHGQLGLGDTNERKTFIQLQTLKNIQFISMGNTLSFFVDTNGTIWACGLNYRNLISESESDSYNFTIPIECKNNPQVIPPKLFQISSFTKIKSARSFGN